MSPGVSTPSPPEGVSSANPARRGTGARGLEKCAVERCGVGGTRKGTLYVLLDRFRLRPRRARLWRRRPHVRDPHLVAASLLCGVERLVRAVDELGEKSRLRSRGDSDADRELQSARKRRGGDSGPYPFCQGARSRLGRLVQDESELLASVSGAHV